MPAYLKRSQVVEDLMAAIRRFGFTSDEFMRATTPFGRVPSRPYCLMGVPPPPPTPRPRPRRSWKCDYCGAHNVEGRERCHECSAPRR